MIIVVVVVIVVVIIIQGCRQYVKSQDRDETETLNPQNRDETETFDFSKLSRPTRDVQPSRPRRDKTFQKTSRDRDVQDRDYIPVIIIIISRYS